MFFKTITTVAGSRSDSHRRSAMTAFKYWTEFLGHEFGDPQAEMAWKKATVDDVMEFISHLKRRPGRAPRDPANTPTFSGATIHLTLANLRWIYRRLFFRGLLTHNPFADPSIPRISKYYNEKRQIRGIPFKKAKEILSLPDVTTKRGLRDKALLSVLFGGGLRRSEMRYLRMSDVRETSKGTCYLNLARTKSQKRQEQALPPWAEKTLNAYMAQRREEGAGDLSPVFVGYRFRGVRAELPEGGFMSESNIFKIFNRHCRRVGLDGGSPHCARYTAALKLHAQRVSVRKIQAFMRHASLTTTEIYLREEIGPDESVARGLVF